MDELIAFELAPGYEEFSGGNVSLVGGEMFDVGEALDEGNGRIVLAPFARVGEDEEVGEAESIRAKRDEEIVDALAKYPGVHRVEAEEGDEPLSFSAVDVTIDSGSTLAELRTRASELEIPGRSTMDKDELSEAIAKKEAELAESVGDSEATGDGDQVADGLAPVGTFTDDDQEGGAGDGEASTEGSDD